MFKLLPLPHGWFSKHALSQKEGAMGIGWAVVTIGSITAPPGGLSSPVLTSVSTQLQKSFGEGNGYPLQYSCLENPVDRGAWWAALHGVAQSRTRLKRLCMRACMHWRRNWQPTPVLLPGESQGRRSLVGYSPWGHKDPDTTERLHFHYIYQIDKQEVFTV